MNDQKKIIPNIKFSENYGWMGPIELDIWKYYRIIGSKSLFDTPQVTVGGDNILLDTLEITQEYINAYYYTVQNQKVMHENIMNSLMKKYEKLKPLYGYEGKEADEFMPDVKDMNQFKNLIQLDLVHLLNVFKDNIAYVGYEFKCKWDPDHGLGFMTHMDRVFKCNIGDYAFTTWVAEEDLEKSMEK
ncbi:MAG: DUF6985 domain-containing protein [Candidatus Hermodarchaeota archaeon]